MPKIAEVFGTGNCPLTCKKASLFWEAFSCQEGLSESFSSPVGGIFLPEEEPRRSCGEVDSRRQVETPTGTGRTPLLPG